MLINVRVLHVVDYQYRPMLGGNPLLSGFPTWEPCTKLCSNHYVSARMKVYLLTWGRLNMIDIMQ